MADRYSIREHRADVGDTKGCIGDIKAGAGILQQIGDITCNVMAHN